MAHSREPWGLGTGGLWRSAAGCSWQQLPPGPPHGALAGGQENTAPQSHSCATPAPAQPGLVRAAPGAPSCWPAFSEVLSSAGVRAAAACCEPLIAASSSGRPLGFSAACGTSSMREPLCGTDWKWLLLFWTDQDWQRGVAALLTLSPFPKPPNMTYLLCFVLWSPAYTY